VPDLNTEPLTSRIEWSNEDADHILNYWDGSEPLTRRLVLQAIEELTKYAAIEDPVEVQGCMSYSDQGAYCRPCRGIQEILHVLVDLLAALVEEEAREGEEVTLTVTRREARTLWNALSGEPFEDPNRTLTFKVEGAIG